MKNIKKLAIQDSIKHWEENKLKNPFKGIELGAEFCPLCKLYCTENSISKCSECPVSILTGQKFCRGTPYHSISFLYNRLFDDDYNEDSYREEWENACEAEIRFLTSLL